MTVAVTDEYIAPDSDLGFMLNYWHGWWRFAWHWHSESKGIVWPDLRMAWQHRQYCDGSWDKIGCGVTFWRLSICFSCEPLSKSNARAREMFPDDIWPTLIEEILDAEVVE